LLWEQNAGNIPIGQTGSGKATSTQIAARLSYEGSGRGAIVIDVTSQAEPDTGHAFAYFSEEQVREYDDPDIARIVQGYDPEHEFVLVLLKSDDRTSTYRIRPVRGN
jgi:hypothetical protein